MGYLAIVRPYEEWKDNLIEINNDVVFSFMIVYLTALDEESDWDTTRLAVVLYVMMISGFIVMGIVLLEAFIKLVSWCIDQRHAKKRSNNKRFRKSQYEVNSERKMNEENEDFNRNYAKWKMASTGTSKDLVKSPE